jgi:AcrR family transcriptional regulator
VSAYSLIVASTLRTLSTAEQRREDLLVAAQRVFAARGLHGTPTTEIAKAAGISQAYLFRLFPTKLELFVACVQRCFEHTAEVFAQAAAEARERGDDVLRAMGEAYGALLRDRDQLLLQMQAYAAADEPAVREVTQTGFRLLVELAQREEPTADAERIQSWFGHGMLMNVLAAMSVGDLDEPWVNLVMPNGENFC